MLLHRLVWEEKKLSFPLILGDFISNDPESHLIQSMDLPTSCIGDSF